MDFSYNSIPDDPQWSPVESKSANDWTEQAVWDWRQRESISVRGASMGEGVEMWGLDNQPHGKTTSGSKTKSSLLKIFLLVQSSNYFRWRLNHCEHFSHYCRCFCEQMNPEIRHSLKTLFSFERFFGLITTKNSTYLSTLNSPLEEIWRERKRMNEIKYGTERMKSGWNNQHTNYKRLQGRIKDSFLLSPSGRSIHWDHRRIEVPHNTNPKVPNHQANSMALNYPPPVWYGQSQWPCHQTICNPSSHLHWLLRLLYRRDIHQNSWLSHWWVQRERLSRRYLRCRLGIFWMSLGMVWCWLWCWASRCTHSSDRGPVVCQVFGWLGEQRCCSLRSHLMDGWKDKWKGEKWMDK